mgnify:CR=1 FL=1
MSVKITFITNIRISPRRLLGNSQQRATDLGVVSSQFDLTSTFGVPAAMNEFFNGFSQLAVNPNDTVARQGILDRAAQVSTAFNQAAIGMQQVSVNVDRQTRDTVAGINRLAEQIGFTIGSRRFSVMLLVTMLVTIVVILAVTRASVTGSNAAVRASSAMSAWSPSETVPTERETRSGDDTDSHRTAWRQNVS